MKESLNDNFTSTGAKFFAHQEVMSKLRNGVGQPIVTHVMATDVCQHSCAFCSVATRHGDVLRFSEIIGYLDLLLQFGLKAVILSGGGNPLLYRCPETRAGISDVVRAIHGRGLEIGMITNGMPLMDYGGRLSYRTLDPEALDSLTWLRVSMSGLDHVEDAVYVPDVDPAKTALGFSYVYHDIYDEPEDKNHGKVSTVADLISLDRPVAVRLGADRLPELTVAIGRHVRVHRARYVRLLPNCLEPHLIEKRVRELQIAAEVINEREGREVAFVQYKPPKAPNACYLGYIHPVLNSDGYVYPCDSCVLNKEARHKFANPWRVCHWSEVERIYREPVRSLVDSRKWCEGCVFTHSNEILAGVVHGQASSVPTGSQMEHVNFV